MTDIRDWFVMLFVLAFNSAGFIYIWQHPSDTVFGIWAGLLTVSGGIYHYLISKDSAN